MKPKMRSRNWRKAIITFVILTVMSALLLFFRVIPLSKTPLSYSKTELRSEGNSEIISYQIDSGGLNFTYRIGMEENASVAAGLWVKDTVDFLNLSGTETMEVTLNPDSCSSFNLALYFHIPGFTIPAIWYTHRMLLTEITVRPGVSTYRIPLRNMHTPLWWYSINRMSKETVAEHINWNRCTGITVGNHDLGTRGEPHRIYINNVVFNPDRFRIVVITLAALVIFYCIWHMRIKWEKHHAIRYKEIHTADGGSVTAEIVGKYLGENYRINSLTMGRVSSDIGIPPAKIRLVMRELHHTTLNDYIVSLRITEAARLLRKTDLQIAEIARSVGYVHVSTFNHHFKNQYKKAPGLYRRNS